MKKANERLKSQAEAASLRDKIDYMVQSNELLTAKTIEAKKELSDKRAQEKNDKWEMLRQEGQIGRAHV